jgi:23S rRNA pseudouridine2605 synthase
MDQRINKFVAQATGLSRRKADEVISDGKVKVNGVVAEAGNMVGSSDEVTMGGVVLKPLLKFTTLIFNKPAGYVCSRNGQGSATIYELLPDNYQPLKPVGRLDKNSEGLLLLTDDGDLAYKLTHPKFAKEKIYEVWIDKPLDTDDEREITTKGVEIGDGLSRMRLTEITGPSHWKVTLSEGRNRQIRRTFEALDYRVDRLFRLSMDEYVLGNLRQGEFKEIQQ